MALKMRKDIKKSSYYVWFLGAQESKGLRGAEYVVPVVQSLIQRERTVEPFKVTLQVSHKGLKIVQNVPRDPLAPKSKKPEVVKHFIPHHAVTCVLQDVDIVSCILLLYNPVTKCPVHVHAYRCDSVETAEILKGQLQTLIERPENQKKLGEIETRLQAKGLLLPPSRGPAARRLHSGGSDGRSTSTRESESSGGSSSERLSGGHQERITNLYDSLAAELREKLGGPKRGPDAPILLPPRDYDTVHRQKGNLTAIDLRRCLNTNIVGVNVKKEAAKTTKAAVISSGGSSGIGSDHAPSPDQVDPEQRYLDNQSSSDEEWTEEPSEDSLFLVQPGAGWPRPELSLPRADLSLPRARRLLSNEALSTPSTPSTPSHAPPDLRRRPVEPRRRSPSPPSPPRAKLAPLKTSKSANVAPTISKLSPRDRFKDAKEKFMLLERERTEDNEKIMQKVMPEGKKRGSLQEMPISPVSSGPPRLVRGHNWSRSRDSEDELEGRPYKVDEDDEVFGYQKTPARRESGVPKSREVEDRSQRGRQDGKPRRVDDAGPVGRGGGGGGGRDNGRASRDKEDVAVPAPRHGGGDRRMDDELIRVKQRYEQDRRGQERRTPERRYSPSRKPQHYSPEREYSPDLDRAPMPRREYSPRQDYSPERRPRRPAEYSPERRPVERVLSPSRHPRPSPRRLDDDDGYPVEPRYRGSRAQVISQIEESEASRYREPMPAPRRPRVAEESPEEQRRYAGAALLAQEKKRRSMFDVMEDERRKSSNELAKEFKRRSYHDGGGSEISGDHSRSSNNLDRSYHQMDSRGDFDSNRRSSQMDLRGGGSNKDRVPPREMMRSNSIETRELRNNQNNHFDPQKGRDFSGRHGGYQEIGYQEIADQERFPGLDRETARHVAQPKGAPPPRKDARYRHSYAEPGLGHRMSLGQPGLHDVLHRTNSSVSSGRVGIAAVHPY